LHVYIHIYKQHIVIVAKHNRFVNITVSFVKWSARFEHK